VIALSAGTLRQPLRQSLPTKNRQAITILLFADKPKLDQRLARRRNRFQSRAHKAFA